MFLNNICILSGGVLTLIMLVFHCFFYKTFQWKNDFNNISVRNKKIIFTIHLALIGCFFIFSFISMFFYNQLNKPESLSLSFLLLLAVFWTLRCIWQILYFKQTKNNKNPFRFMHYILIIFFFVLSLVYVIPFVCLILK